MRARSAIVRRHPQPVLFDNRRASLHAWQDRIRNPSLTVLLALQLILLFLAVPVAVTGLPIAEPIGEWLMLTALAEVVMLSHRGGAIVMILLGLGAARVKRGKEHRVPLSDTAPMTSLLSVPVKIRNSSARAAVPAASAGRPETPRFRCRAALHGVPGGR